MVCDATPCAHARGRIRDHKNSYLLSPPRALITASSSQSLTLRCLEAQSGEAGALGDKSTVSPVSLFSLCMILAMAEIVGLASAIIAIAGAADTALKMTKSMRRLSRDLGKISEYFLKRLKRFLLSSAPLAAL